MRLVTDKLSSYRAAHRAVIPSVAHSTDRYANNRAEVSHQPTRQREPGDFVRCPRRPGRYRQEPFEIERFSGKLGYSRQLCRSSRVLRELGVSGVRNPRSLSQADPVA